ncbi:MAG: hypothetical protein COV44_07035 [Deltaproteobacteria bacterium CG11_big_fil_rev_8_21_14_0_20_45_16]|nr:MAG: hypothetical protein COV44_07035 [Deltaproteobacteria bacterium CG11_big_fil_rev_8_21_14_0_20_45_16]
MTLTVLVFLTIGKIPKLLVPAELLLIILLALLFHVWGSYLSRTLYGEVRGDISNILSVALVTPIFIAIVQSNHFSRLRNTFVSYCGWGGFLAALLCLYKFKLLLNGEKFWWVELWIGNRPYPWGTSLQPDYNMCALGLTIGFLCLVKLFLDCPRIFGKMLIFCSALIVFSSVVLTGSRRGLVVLLVLTLTGFFYGLYKLMSGFILQKIHPRSFRGFVAISMVVLIIFSIFLMWKGLNIADMQVHEVTRLTARFDTMKRFAGTLMASRSGYLERGLEIFQRGNLLSLLFGGGFDYLSAMSVESKEVYPHNPLISALLYGGIFGFIFTLYVLVRGLLVWISLLGQERLLAVIFVVFNVFSFISSNSYFSVRFGCFILAIGLVLIHDKRLQGMQR